MQKNKKAADKGIRITALKIVLLTAIVVIIAGVVIYVITGFFESGEPTDPGHISGSEHLPGSESGSEHETGSETISQNSPEPEVEPEPSPDPTPQPAVSISRIDINSTNPDLTDVLDRESRSHNCAAVSLVVYDGYTGRFYTYNYGYADISAKREANSDTKYRFASLTKTVVAICAMKLVEESKLDLDEDISTYLGYRVRNPDYPDTPITSRMLMQHTSTIYNSNAFNDSLMGRRVRSTEELLTGDSSFWSKRPGTAHEYSNFGYTVLGAVIEFASGMKLDTYAREVLFDPLDIDAAFLAAKLNDTGNIAVLYRSGQGHAVDRSVAAQLEKDSMGALGQDQNLAQGSLMISAIDYAKIMAMLGNGGIILGERILSQDSVIEIHKADIEGPAYMQGLSTRFTNGGSADGISEHTVVDEIDDSLSHDADDQLIDNEALNLYGIYRVRVVEEEHKIWQYNSEDGAQVPSEGFFWHTGSANGIFAQYVYAAGNGTEKGIADVNSSRGVVVVTTGASTDREENGMINVCTHLSGIVWLGLKFDQVN